MVVNQPDFTLRVMNGGTQAWTTRIVIGKPSTATPLLSETMKSITVNPTWTVPPSIVHNEYLPAMAQDPTVLERMGLRVSYSGGGVRITQPPGPGNALGRIRFNFPNRFIVYQHDTPDKHMFAHEVRAYSHGCMRVQDPAKYAEVLLKLTRPGEHWTAQRITNMFGRGEQNFQLQPAQVWVHLTYQTAFSDSAGKLQIRRDIYNLDSRTLAAIKSQRDRLEPAPERKHEHEIASGSGVRRSAPPRPRANRRPVPAQPGHFGLCRTVRAATDLSLSGSRRILSRDGRPRAGHQRLLRRKTWMRVAIPGSSPGTRMTKSAGSGARAARLCTLLRTREAAPGVLRAGRPDRGRNLDSAASASAISRRMISPPAGSP